MNARGSLLDVRRARNGDRVVAARAITGATT